MDAVSIGSRPSGVVIVVSSRVVIDGDLIRRGHGLAGQHVAGVDLAGFEGVVAAHGPGATGDLGPAGAAHATLAGERQVGPDLPGPGQGRRGGPAGWGGRNA